jgi:flagellar biogenesis protein FliO
MSQDDPDPIASTQMFRRFTDEQLNEQPQRRGGFSTGQRTALYGALLGVIVIVAVVVWLILR